MLNVITSWAICHPLNHYLWQEWLVGKNMDLEINPTCIGNTISVCYLLYDFLTLIYLAGKIVSPIIKPIIHCLRVSLAAIKHHGWKVSWGLFGLHFSIVLWSLHFSSLLKEDRIETQTGQDPRNKNWCRGHGRELLMACFPCLAKHIL